jgi:hypothetical protein
LLPSRRLAFSNPKLFQRLEAVYDRDNTRLKTHVESRD